MHVCSFTDMALIEAFTEMVHAMKKRRYQVGTATVSSNAKAPCPSEDRGESAEAEQDGCQHDDCTAAKNAARAALIAEVDPNCHKYITSTKPCKKVNCS